MDISTIKAGDEIYVFSREKDRYLKLPVRIGNAGLKYVEVPNRDTWCRPDMVALAEGLDAVTAEELPAAKKRHAARRKAEKAAAEALALRVAEARKVAQKLFSMGVGRGGHTVTEGGLVIQWSGRIAFDLSLEQARALLDALKGGA